MKNIIKVSVILFVGFFIVSRIRKYVNVKNTLDLKVMTDGDVINIHGLGNYNKKSLLVIKNIIESHYHLPVNIDDNITLDDDYYVSKYVIDSDKFLSDFDSNTNNIYVTNEKAFSESAQKFIKGKGEIYGNILLINEYDPSTISHVLIHEMSHNQGLTHCDNPNCIMFHKITKQNKNKGFCNECKKSL